MNQIKSIEKSFDEIAGAELIKEKLSKARRLLKKEDLEIKTFNSLIDEANTTYLFEKEWRAIAEKDLLPQLIKFDSLIKKTIGLRLQKKLTKEQAQEIKDQQNQEHKTKRVTVPELEKILYEAIPLLDHGFIRVIDYMGDDTSIVQAARVSYGKGTKKVSTDAGLIKYLMRHWHSTPFEMCEIKYHVKLPIFIARQWIRHRTANVNEYSARYSILDKEFYLPSKKNLAAQSTSNRQGRGEIINGKQAHNILEICKALLYIIDCTFHLS